MRNVQPDLALTVANGQIGDVDAGLETGPVRRQFADGELRVDFLGDQRFDARPERVDPRQQAVAQSHEEDRRDEIDDERNCRQHPQGVTQHHVVVAAHWPDLSGFVWRGGFVSLGHAAAGVGVW